MSLVDAVIAAGLVTTIAAGVAHLLVWSRHQTWSAGVRSVSASAAVQKMEQLRALAWYVDGAGTPVSDTTASLAEDPAVPGGLGLQPSPGGVLEENTAGFVDYVDAQGRWCGTGAQPPPCAAFVRRWAVAALASDPADTRVLSVLVLPAGESSQQASPRAVRLRTLLTRVAR